MSSALGATAAVAAGLDAKASAQSVNRPNVLIFMPDQQNGATVLPGSQMIKPNLDKFRGESVTFTEAHCPAPHCCPSRASFMSGWYPSEHGIYNNVSTDTAIHIDPYPGTPFWGNDLKRAGYQTAYSGKLHVGRNVTPEMCGFESLGSAEQNSLLPPPTARLKHYKQTRQENYDPANRKPGEILRPGWGNLQMYQTQPNAKYETLPDYRVVQSGIAGMKRLAANSKPWCVMISNSGGHDTYDVPKKFVDMYEGVDIELPKSYRDTLADKPGVYQRQRYEYWSQLSDSEAKECLKHYYAKLTMQDALFGEILAALEATGQAENTI
ncbi:MAG: sulfatase-like hydrolase/transferase, partial [Bryocella sp.]